MAVFLTVVDAAAQLDVSEALLRQWIKRGLARAARRGGDYILRQTEVDRLQAESAELPHQLTPGGDSQEKEIAQDDEPMPDSQPSPRRLEIEAAAAPTEPPSAPRRPKVLPPRSGRDPDSFAGEKDRRRRMGRRASDFTLEILHREIKSAIGAVLDPLLPRLDEIQAKLKMPTPTGQPDSSQALALEQRILELEAQQQHLEEARESYRHRLEQSERERQNLELQVQQAIPLRQRLEESDRERKRLEEWAQEVQRQQAQHDDGTQQLLQRISQELQAERQLRLDGQEQIERLRDEISELHSASLTMEAERARFSLESRSLQGEIDRLTSMQEQWDTQKRELEQSQQRLAQLEKVAGDAQNSMQENDQEVRRLREQVNSLTYRLQMAGTGSAGPSPEESRRLMEKLADAQAEMDEKNQLITEHYAVISDLRSKLDAVQRNNYELQQRYDKLYDEWGQMAAQLASKQMSDHQQQQAPAPSPDRNKGWGLFGRRDG